MRAGQAQTTGPIIIHDCIDRRVQRQNGVGSIILAGQEEKNERTPIICIP
jgi:hypothetical protein